MMTQSRFFLTSSAWLARMLAVFAFAMSLWGLAAASADHRILLMVTNHETGQVTGLTDPELAALPQVAFQTGTMWTEDVETFEGPTLRSVLRAAGLDPDKPVLASAENDYTIVIDPALTDEKAPIIAMRRNGEAFDLRQKGPLWVVYPFDSSDAFNTEQHFSISIWQLVAIESLPEE